MSEPATDEEIKTLRHTMLSRQAFTHSVVLSLIARIDAEKARADVAMGLLQRVVVQGGAGSWSDAEMQCWACDYKDLLNGYLGLAGHENCHHAGGGKAPR